MWWETKQFSTKIRKIFQTRFYYDISDLDHFIILHQTKFILRELDKKRGYVERSWFLDNHKNVVQGLRLNKKSCVVECVVQPGIGPTEKNRLFIR